MNYNKFTGVILKKQNYKEADQIVTIWSKELGKVRILARGLRSGKSKLAYSMQDLALVEVETAGRKNFHNLISAKILKNFLDLRQDLAKMAVGFYAMELMLKITADEQPNLEAYNLLEDFLSNLNSADLPQTHLSTMLDHFSLKLLQSLGFSIEFASSSFKVPSHLSESIFGMLENPLNAVPYLSFNETSIEQLHRTVKNFIEFILERNLKSDLFLVSI